MDRFQKIVVGVNFAKFSGDVDGWLEPPVVEAIETGMSLCENEPGSELIFLAVMDDRLDPSGKGTSESLVSLRSEVEAYLGRLVRKAEEKGVNARFVIDFGRSWHKITQFVISENVDLVVVGTRPMSRASSILLGNTAMKLFRQCPCPVWATRPGRIGNEWTVLVAEDLTEIGENCIQLGVQAAKRMNARLVVLHAVDFQYDTRLHLCGLPKDEIETYRQKKLRDAEQEVHARLSKTDYRSVPGGVQVRVMPGPADLAVHNALEEFDVDLLVMGTIARAGIPGMLVGNTAERLLPQLNCSLLAIKPDDFKSPLEVLS